MEHADKEPMENTPLTPQPSKPADALPPVGTREPGRGDVVFKALAYLLMAAAGLVVLSGVLFMIAMMVAFQGEDDLDDGIADSAYAVEEIEPTPTPTPTPIPTPEPTVAAEDIVLGAPLMAEWDVDTEAPRCPGDVVLLIHEFDNHYGEMARSIDFHEPHFAAADEAWLTVSALPGPAPANVEVTFEGAGTIVKERLEWVPNLDDEQPEYLRRMRVALHDWTVTVDGGRLDGETVPMLQLLQSAGYAELRAFDFEHVWADWSFCWDPLG